MRIPPNNILNILAFISASSIAAPKGPPPPGVPPPPGLPIDGCAFLCLFFALIYGLYKINNIRAKKSP